MAYHGFAQFPYGAVYFRKSSPQKKDFARDYAQAAQDGMNTFRHWFLWHAIEVAPGVYDWDEWDTQLELAEKHGMKTIIAECIHAAPEWVFHELSHARFQDQDGRAMISKMRNSTATAGFSGLCLDHTDYRTLAGNFLTTLAKRYKGHPGLGGYDVMNENNLWSSGYVRCFCPATQESFRRWLRAKYGDLKTLAQVWRRYSFTDWAQVEIPRGYDVYPEYFDYADFTMEHTLEAFRWRVDILRAADPDVAILGHGVHDSSLHRRLDGNDDAWEFAKPLDGYGYSGGGYLSEPERDGKKRWAKIMIADVTRMAADGKPFWACERGAGPTYTLSDGRFRHEFNEFNAWIRNMDLSGAKPEARTKPTGADLRANDFIAMAGGAKGLFSHRWRGLDDGPMFGTMGYYNQDGSPNDRTEAAAVNAKWANAPEQQSLWASSPVPGDLAILNCPESQTYAQLLYKTTGLYIHAVRGIYSALMDGCVQPDIVKLDQLPKYSCAYLPYPFCLKRETVERLMEWVAEGGVLISEGCPGYADGMGHVDAVQPSMGLDRLFGCRESDIYIGSQTISLERLTFSALDCDQVYAGILEQDYRLTTGSALGHFSNGQIAVVENRYGKGRTLLMGTVLGLGFYEHQTDSMRQFFQALLAWSGIEQKVRSTDKDLLVRLHDGPGGAKLWIVNPYGKPKEAVIRFHGAYAEYHPVYAHRGILPREAKCGFTVTVPPRDALVWALEKE